MLMTYLPCLPKETMFVSESKAVVKRFAQVLNAPSRRSTDTVVCPRER